METEMHKPPAVRDVGGWFSKIVHGSTSLSEQAEGQFKSLGWQARRPFVVSHFDKLRTGLSNHERAAVFVLRQAQRKRPS
jgi:hypothetical protein